jgi:uncharacterized radical SAM protein YgiQ
MQTARDISTYRRYWASRFGTAPFLPMSRAEMDLLGWDSCDVIVVTGDAYVDHPSFGMAIIGRVLEAQGFRVGIIAQPDWHSVEPFAALGRPNLFFGVTAGNMDSMVNRYTSDRRVRSDDAYTPGDVGGKRPDRAVIVYSQRVREAFKDVPLVIGGIEASLRRIAHFDYWSEKVRRSVLLDAKADHAGVRQRRAGRSARLRTASRPARDSSQITDMRGTAFARKPRCRRIGSRLIPHTWMRQVRSIRRPIRMRLSSALPTIASAVAATAAAPRAEVVVRFVRGVKNADRDRSVIRMPSYEQVLEDPVLYAHASRILHLESNPGNARALVQRHGNVEVWLNPPPIPLTTREMDWIYELPYQRRPHPDVRRRADSRRTR